MLSSKKELKKFSEAFKFVRNQRFPNKSLKNVSLLLDSLYMNCMIGKMLKLFLLFLN